MRLPVIALSPVDLAQSQFLIEGDCFGVGFTDLKEDLKHCIAREGFKQSFSKGTSNAVASILRLYRQIQNLAFVQDPAPGDKARNLLSQDADEEVPWRLFE